MNLSSYRLRCYAYAIRRACLLVGLQSLFTDLRGIAAVRTLAYAGQLDLLACLVAAARVHAGNAGLADAARQLADREAEIAELRADAERAKMPSRDVVVLDDDWGKRGRGAKIVAWIASTGASAEQVMARFQLARSTSKRYVRRAIKEGRICKKAA